MLTSKILADPFLINILNLSYTCSHPVLKASEPLCLMWPRRDARSVKNPPAPRPPGERRRVRSCLKKPAGGSCPGSAWPAEAITFTSFFSSFFSPRNFSPEIPPRASPGDTPGTPKSREFRLFATKVVPGTLFLSIFWSISVFHTFWFDFWSVFHRKIMKKQTIISQPHLFFFDLATLRIVCILRCERHVLYFCFYQDFHKKCIKFQAKTAAKKNITKWCPWGLKIIPKCIKVRCFSFRKHKIAPKK